jgi:hypothetical protein
MPDLYSNSVASGLAINARKTAHDTFNYGTPAIYPLVIIRQDAGNFNNPSDNNSDFHKVMTVIQTKAEVYGIGEISGGSFTVLVHWNTLPQDSTANENTGSPQIINGDLDYLATEINDIHGISVKVWHGKLQGSSLVYNDC